MTDFSDLEVLNVFCAKVLDRCFCAARAADRDLCYLLWAAATVPNWANNPCLGEFFHVILCDVDVMLMCTRNHDIDLDAPYPKKFP